MLKLARQKYDRLRDSLSLELARAIVAAPRGFGDSIVQATLSIRTMVNQWGWYFLVVLNRIPPLYLLRGRVLVQLMIGLTLFPIF